MIAADVFFNGHHVATHGGGYTPFSADLTPYLVDGDNLLRVRLDSTERTDIPPYGFVVDYLTFGGLYRDVHLRLIEPCHIADVFVRPLDALTQPRLEVDVILTNHSDQPVTRRLGAAIVGLADIPAQSVTLAAGERATVTLRSGLLPNAALWMPDAPTLYVLNVALLDVDNTPQDAVDVRFGWREAHFDKDGSFYLNGQPLKLRGLNRHQTYP
jgi:beta-galactosidase